MICVSHAIIDSKLSSERRRKRISRPRFCILILSALLLSPALRHTGMAQSSMPDWARGAVWYQIYIDRFDNGYTGNDPSVNPANPGFAGWRTTPWPADWYLPSDAEIGYSADPAARLQIRGYGGDLNGVLRRLDYLDSLGVQVLHLSPVFESPSFHRFNASSFHHVDASLGGSQPFSAFSRAGENPLDTATWRMTPADSTFLRLITEAHRRKMRVVIDAAFHHTSDRFWAFRDVLLNQQHSQYADWFDVASWDDPLTPSVNEFRCRGMGNNPAYPLFRSDSLGYALGLRNYLFLVTRKWMDPNGDGNPSDGIDGWCVRSLDEMPLKFMKEWLRYTKRINEHSIVVGAEGEGKPASGFADLRLSHLFLKPVLQFFASPIPLEASRFDDILQQENRPVRKGRMEENRDEEINLLSSYDTDRILSMIARNFRPESVGADRLTLTAPPSDEARAIQKLAALFQFTFTGSPSVLYGDEAGIWGAHPMDRLKPMPWFDLRFDPEHPFLRAGDTTGTLPAFDTAMCGYYRRLALLRRGHVALQGGAIMTVVIDNQHGVYGFKRKSGIDEVFCIFNASRSPQSVRVPIPGTREGTRVNDPVNELYFYCRKDLLEIRLPAKTGAVLIPSL